MTIFNDITFLNLEYFWGLLIMPIILYFFYKRQRSGINFINLSDVKQVFKNNNYKFYLSIILLGLILINFIFILANPNKINISEKIKKNGIDIVIALDVSGSMEAEDLKPNRLESAKKVIDGFIKNLKTDRVGIVVFAGKPFTSIPLTFDYNIISETLNRLSTKDIQSNGTAIGDAILMSKTLFKPHPNPPLTGDGNKKTLPPERGELEEGQNREKVIILLTDGDANLGVDPKIAGISAKEAGIKIYTIGIGSKTGGYITYDVGPFKQRQKIPPLNDKYLKEISKITDGKYFRADNNKTFEAIFKELQKLEKNDIEVKIKKKYTNYYDIFVYSLIFLIMSFGVLMIGNLEIRKKKNQ